MTRLSSSAFALAASAAALAAGAGGAAAKAKPSCATRGKTVVANSRTRVYTVRRSGGRKLYFGCVNGHRRHWLGSQVPPDPNDLGETRKFVDQVQLNRRRVTYERRTCRNTFGTAGCKHAVRTVDARSGKLLFRNTQHGAEFLIVAASDGSFATASEFGIGPEEVVSYTGPNGTVELDHASGDGISRADEIDVYSLAIGGKTIYWTHNGRPRSAPIPPAPTG